MERRGGRDMGGVWAMLSVKVDGRRAKHLFVNKYFGRIIHFIPYPASPSLGLEFGGRAYGIRSYRASYYDVGSHVTNG